MSKKVKLIINKEIWSEVLGEEIVEIGSFNMPMLEINTQHYSFREWRQINIHEVVSEIKDFILKHYSIDLRIRKEETELWLTKDSDSLKKFSAESEIEAVCKAIEYISKKPELKG